MSEQKVLVGVIHLQIILIMMIMCQAVKIKKNQMTNLQLKEEEP